MEPIVLFKYILISIIIIFSRIIHASPCYPQGNILQCNLTGNSVVDITSNELNGVNSIDIIYQNNVTLYLKTPSVDLIRIRPYDDDDDQHTLQISSIQTTAIRIEIKIHLSVNQNLLPLFNAASSVMATNSILNINVKQTSSDASTFKIFSNANLPTFNLAKYEVVFDNSSTYRGNLNFPDLIRGLNNVSSLLIYGNKHLLMVDSSRMPSLLTVKQLVLKNLHLHDQILYNFNNLNEYIIEECEYNRTAQILQADKPYDISLIMKYNNPLNFILPNGNNAFNGILKYHSITLIEPKLTSSCLKTIKGSNPGMRKLVLSLGNYTLADFDELKSNSPIVQDLTILDIPNLNIFPSKFFNSIDSLEKLVLKGTFALQKSHICSFVGINILDNVEYPLITLDSTKKSYDWDKCADTYIQAINIRTMANVKCLPDDTDDDCDRWCTATAQCSLIKYENNCSSNTITRVKPFSYNNSYLYYFFQKRLWSERPVDPATRPKDDSMNIGAIIGAVCGLLIAIVILGLTIFCIYRRRKNNSKKNFMAPSERKYIYSSDDPTHVSIATSKTSQSSRAELQKSFFPPMQPNDEIAPPLYTAPSESARSTSIYSPTAPPAPRDSISTHATHVYETVDS